MATIIGKSSAYLKNKSFETDLVGFIVFTSLGALAVIFFEFSALRQVLSPNVLIGILLAGFVLLFFLKAVGDSALATGNKYISGHRGENIAEKVLVSLPETYTVFRDVTIDKWGNIDYVVVGPNGVFVVEVKNHQGQIAFDGSLLTRNGRSIEKDLLRQATAESARIRKYLEREIGFRDFVTVILLFTNKYASLRFGTTPVENVYVIRSEYIQKVIESTRGSLSRPQIDRIVVALRKTVPV